MIELANVFHLEPLYIQVVATKKMKYFGYLIQIHYGRFNEKYGFIRKMYGILWECEY